MLSFVGLKAVSLRGAWKKSTLQRFKGRHIKNNSSSLCTTRRYIPSSQSRASAEASVDPVMNPTATKRVLSIQSHVTSGYVGNRAAVFPLQLLGYDVDILNSCSLSNHTGYKYGATGQRLTGDDMNDLLQGMKSNGLLGQISHLLTGYIGTPSCLNAILSTVELLHAQATPDLTYVCDPVLGDNGRLYVSEELVQIYKHSVLDLASVLTPNSFELGILSGRSIENEKEAFEACDILYERHRIPMIIVTGTCFEEPKRTVSVLVSSRRNGEKVRFAVDAEHKDGKFTGTGDMMSALLLAWNDKLIDDPMLACSNAMASVSAVLERTMELPRSIGHCAFPELRLIQSQDVILNPPRKLIKVRPIS